MNMFILYAFLTGSPGPGEILLIFLVILVLFGPKRLPEIARSIGRILNDLRNASNDFKSQVMRIDHNSSIDETLEKSSLDQTDDKMSIDLEPYDFKKESSASALPDKEDSNDLAG